MCISSDRTDTTEIQCTLAGESSYADMYANASTHLPRTETTLSAFETQGYLAIIFPTTQKQTVATFYGFKREAFRVIAKSRTKRKRHFSQELH